MSSKCLFFMPIHIILVMLSGTAEEILRSSLLKGLHLQAVLQAVMERQAALSLAVCSKPAAAFALMASAAKPPLKEVRARSMSGPLMVPELTPSPSMKHAIGGGAVQVLQTASIF